MQGLLQAQRSRIGADRAAASAARMDSLLAIVTTELDSARGVARIESLLVAPDGMRTFRNYAFMPSEPRALAAWYMSSWYRSELKIDPGPILRSVRVPVLAITGSVDQVLPAQSHLPAIARALRAGGNPDVSIREVPNVNHLMQTAVTGAVGEYAPLRRVVLAAGSRDGGDVDRRAHGARRGRKPAPQPAAIGLPFPSRNRTA